MTEYGDLIPGQSREDRLIYAALTHDALKLLQVLNPYFLADVNEKKREDAQAALVKLTDLNIEKVIERFEGTIDTLKVFEGTEEEKKVMEQLRSARAFKENLTTGYNLIKDLAKGS